MVKPSFLIVDDDPIALQVTGERLERLGFSVTLRSQSLGTSGWIIQNRPDFVLLDVMMPALSGAELARVLKRRGVSTRIVLHSSKPMAELRRLVAETGVLGGISKDLPESAFTDEIVRLVQSSPESRSIGSKVR